MSSYVVDSSALIQAKNDFYAFDIFPKFWELLCPHTQEGKVVFIKDVYDEVLKGNKEDSLVCWIKQHKELCKSCQNENEVVGYYKEMANWIVKEPSFGEGHVSNFLNGADLWIISYARKHNFTVVTLEKLVGTNSRKVKIPNVCKHFGVKCVNIYDMLRGLEVKV